MLWNEDASLRFMTWNTTIYYETLEHIYIVLALWDPDDMCYEKRETDIYMYREARSADRGIGP